MYRKRERRRSGRKYFSKTADRVKSINYANPMRGGIRL